MTDCIFCKIIAGEIPSNKVYEDDQVYAFSDIAPMSPMHVLIIPKRHIESVSKLTLDDAPLVMHMISVANEVAANLKISKSGYRLVFNNGEDAGQTVFHVHMHLVGGAKLGEFGVSHN